MALHRLGTVVLVVVLALSLLTGVGACTSGSDTGDGSGSTEGGALAPTGDPEIDKGLALVESKCSLCHTLDRVESASKDAAGWEQTVARMRDNGAVMTDAEAQQIVDYLSSR